MGRSLEELARACARRPWRVVAAWIAAAVAAAGTSAALLGSAVTTEATIPASADTESQRAERLLEERFPRSVREGVELVVLRGERVEARLGPVAVARRRAGAAPLPGEAVVRPDGRAALLPFRLDAGASIADVLPVVEAQRGVEAEVYGGAIVDRDFEEVSQRDLRTGESFGVAAALVVLVLVFGALVAALVPLALALVAVTVTLGVVSLIGQAVTLSIFVTNIVSGMGLALGIDYALFVVSRYREERARGRAPEDAIAGAGATATRAVAFSGTAVALALCALLIPPDTVLRSLGAGAAIVAVVSVVAAATLLPALLGLLGDRVDAVRVPLLGGSGAAEGRLWSAVARAVMRRPGTSLVLSAALLLAAALPVLGLETGSSGVSTLPDRTPAKRGFVLLDETFSIGRQSPTLVVVDGPADGAVGRLRSLLARDAAFGEVRVRPAPGGRLLRVEVPVAGDPTSERAVAAVERLRTRYVPEAAFPTGTDVLVGGETALHVDYVNASNAARPLVFVFVLALSFLLLTVAFRSLVVPLKAILLNLLSVGAAYGLLVLVFQHGIGNELLGLDRAGRVDVWVPLLLFSVLFGLSMDYHVFLLSRIRERYLATGDNAAAVEHGIATTGRIITGAALIIIVVFCGFALGELVMFQQMGFGVGVALLLDATVVRSVLVPASMRLLGRWNWYLPAWLEWLPRVELEAPRRDGAAVTEAARARRRAAGSGAGRR